ncbi:unnamed protein product [Symbiodinium pilosum]|uniref:Phytanoyl-CoA dioxygenase n=1 Tax=Symbiodinium pilosum TaxID=2952 RepID=A0A812X372_SYMPI|nr:unnamed protein product [Symbiodinium pilosum]
MASLSCLEGLRRLANVNRSVESSEKLIQEEGSEALSDAERKALRRDGWAAAQLAAQAFLREWMQAHPGEALPESIFVACQEAVNRQLPHLFSGREGGELLSFVRYAHKDLLRVEDPPKRLRSTADWESIFPRYPTLDDGYLKSFEACDSQGIRQALDKYGFCVVKVLSRQECEASIVAMFEEINLLRAQKGIEGPAVDVDDPSTWFDKNWPSSCKFLVDDVALHKQAFANRRSQRIYQAFCGIWREEQLHVSVDKWGVSRGAIDRPRWRVGLKPHWDVNPWQCVRDWDAGIDPGYQGVVALRDQDLETGCHLTLPGCTNFLRQWCLERRFEKVSNSSKSFRASEEDPILQYMQPVPLRQGEMVIWSCAQLHGSTHNLSGKMRLAQYIRMFPAPKVGGTANYDEKDNFSCTRVLRRALKKGQLSWSDLEDLQLDPLGRQLLGVDLLHED